VDVTGRDPVDRHTLALSVPLGPPRTRAAFLLRSTVSEEHGNVRRAWNELGRPRSPHPRQLEVLRATAEPARTHRSLPVVDGRVDLDLTLGRHEVTLVELTAVRDETPPWWDETRLLGQPGRDPDDGRRDRP
jgi:xylan 1,4-beta-xylosidase